LSKTLYEILGVEKSAPDDEIRKSYRKLAKQYHPDLNPGDKEAEERFKDVASAFAILDDKDKRARYDAGEIDEAGAEKPQYEFYRQHADTDRQHQYHSSAGYEDFADMGDVFSEIFRQQRGGGGRQFEIRGADVRYHMKVAFLEAAQGAKKRITMPDGVTLDVSIPRGIDSGQTIRLKGKGHPGINGGAAGDALVEIEVEPHPLFERDGLDILIDFPIAIDEAVLGGKVEVPTISGTVRMTLPKGASSGQTLRLAGRGIKARSGKTKGDQLVRLKIVLPQEIDAELEAFMTSWREKHAFDPRADREFAT